MKTLFKLFLLTILIVSQLEATPSSVFWTNCTTDVYETGTGHIDVDNYFTVFNKFGHGSAFAPEVGFEVGLFTRGKVKCEAGVDYFVGANNPIYFNIGFGIDKVKIFMREFSFKVGLFNAGARFRGSNNTNEYVFDLIMGTSLPEQIGGRFFIGGFTGNKAMGKNRQGFMIAYQKSFCPAKYCDDTEYFKWTFCADYASGKNTIGGGGIGIVYNFTPTIDIITGPVWFNSKAINGNWKWSVQIDISFPLFKTCKKECNKNIGNACISQMD